MVFVIFMSYWLVDDNPSPRRVSGLGISKLLVLLRLLDLDILKLRLETAVELLDVLKL